VTRIDYTLSGCANGHPVRIAGRGTATGKRLQVAFTAAEAPVTFDAGLAHVVGLDVVAAVGAGLVTAPDGPLVARCRADLFGEGGVEVGTIAAVATVERRRGRVAGLGCCVQLAEARVAFEPGERVVSIGERAVIAVPQAGGVVLFSAAAISTSRGREWTVLASTLLVGCDGGEQRAATLPATRVPASRAGRARFSGKIQN